MWGFDCLVGACIESYTCSVQVACCCKFLREHSFSVAAIAVAAAEPRLGYKPVLLLLLLHRPLAVSCCCVAVQSFRQQCLKPLCPDPSMR